MSNINQLYYEAVNYYNGTNGFPLDHKEAFIRFLSAAKAGHAQSLFSTAYMYTHGEGVEKNLQKGFLLYQKAAAAGDSRAEMELGKMYYYGEFVPRNLDEAYKHYLIAANAGESNGAYMAGLICLNHYQNYQQAFSCFSTSVKINNKPEAYHNLGFICEKRKGPYPTEQSAVGFYQEAAKRNFPESMCALGKIYANKGLIDEGIKWVTKAVNLGYPPAEKLLKLLKVRKSGSLLDLF